MFQKTYCWNRFYAKITIVETNLLSFIKIEINMRYSDICHFNNLLRIGRMKKTERGEKLKM